jgi:hypothetical protein
MTGGAYTPRSQQFLQSQSATLIEKPFNFASLRRLIKDVTDQATREVK